MNNVYFLRKKNCQPLNPDIYIIILISDTKLHSLYAPTKYSFLNCYRPLKYYNDCTVQHYIHDTYITEGFRCR